MAIVIGSTVEIGDNVIVGDGVSISNIKKLETNAKTLRELCVDVVLHWCHLESVRYSHLTSSEVNYKKFSYMNAILGLPMELLPQICSRMSPMALLLLESIANKQEQVCKQVHIHV